MHISDGVLPLSVCVGGFAASAGLFAATLRRVEMEELPRVAVVSSAFFVASLIHVPLGPASVHLLLIGLAGVVLGAAAFPAIALALFFQCVLFQFGGLTSLGVNMVVMGVPALIAGAAFGWVRRAGRMAQVAAGALCGGLGTVLAAVLFALALATAGEDFVGVAKITVAAHLPVAAIEAAVTAFVVSFLLKVKPEMIRPAAV